MPPDTLCILVLLIIDLLQLTYATVKTLYRLSITGHRPELIIPTALKTAHWHSVSPLRFLWRYLIVFTGIDFENWIRGNLFSHLLELPRSFYHSTKTGDLMAHATNDINQIRMASSAGIIIGEDALFVTASTVTIMATTIDPMLSILALIPMPLIAIGVRFVGRIIHGKYIRVQGVFLSFGKSPGIIQRHPRHQSSLKRSRISLPLTKLTNQTIRQICHWPRRRAYFSLPFALSAPINDPRHRHWNSIRAQWPDLARKFRRFHQLSGNARMAHDGHGDVRQPSSTGSRKRRSNQ